MCVRLQISSLQFVSRIYKQMLKNGPMAKARKTNKDIKEEEK